MKGTRWRWMEWLWAHWGLWTKNYLLTTSFCFVLYFVFVLFIMALFLVSIDVFVKECECRICGK
jgi:hypothetical protein